jgi:multidrug efflux pump subunit AcrA (membrane-fusion protein)
MTMRQVSTRLKKLWVVNMSLKELVEPRLPYVFFKLRTLKFILIVFILLLFCPWIAFTVGKGQVTAINPSERVQSITAPIGGFVKTWHVKEGDYVTEGQVIADLIDNDPSLLDRLEKEMEAARDGLTSAKLMMDTANIDLRRQKELFQEGLASSKSYEKAKIDFSKHVVEHSKNLAVLTKAQTQLSRQNTQKVVSPRNGTVTRIIPGERGMLIKAGTPIAIFAPDVNTPSVELWIDGNDASMLQVGQSVELQFEGWPAIQIAGWPSIAIGTFKGKVHLVDQASSHKGKFRVLIIASGAWPSSRILRLGVHAKGYIKLKDTFVFIEIWRQLNGFPAVIEPIEDELNKMLLKKNDTGDGEELKKK